MFRLSSWVRADGRNLALVVVLASVASLLVFPVVSYEAGRWFIESQIRHEISYQNEGDICKWQISSVPVDFLQGRIVGVEGTIVHKTGVGNWRSVLNAAFQVRNNLWHSDKPWHEQPCLLIFSLTRTLFVLEANVTQNPTNQLQDIVDLVYATYAPY